MTTDQNPDSPYTINQTAHIPPSAQHSPSAQDPAFVSPVLTLLERLKVLHLNKSRAYNGGTGAPLRNYKVAAGKAGVEPWRYTLMRVFEKQERITHILRLPEPEMLAGLVEELQDTALIDLITVALIEERQRGPF